MTNALKVGLGAVAFLILASLGYLSFGDILQTAPTEQPEKNEESEKRSKFTIEVKDKDTKLPLKDVDVFFSYSGAPVPKLTDTNGYVGIEIPSGKDIQVTLSKAGYVTQNFTINSRIDIDNNKTYWLEKDSSPGSSSTSPTPTNGLAPSPGSPAPSIPSSTLQEGLNPESLKKEARNILKNERRNGIYDAREKFLEAQKLDPNDPQLAYYLAWLDHLNYSLSIEDKSDYAPYGIPVCQPAKDRYEKPLDLFDKYPPEDSIGKEMIVEIGHFLSNIDKNHERARKLYNKYILDKNDDISEPVTYLALVSRGIAYFWDGEYGNAESDFTDALAEDPSNQVAYNLGSVYAMQGISNSQNYEKAANWYSLAIGGGNGTLSASGHKGEEVYLSGEPQLDEAWRDFGFVLLLNLENQDILRQDYGTPMEKFEEAIKLRRKNYLAKIGKGIAQYFEGNTDNAIKTLEEVPPKDSYAKLAKLYINKIERCELEGIKCVNYSKEVKDLTDVSIIPILTSQGISKMFGNVVVHDNPSLDDVLATEHHTLYKGPCPN